MRSTSMLALAASLSTTQAAFQGFNYASTKPDGSVMELQDWEDAFAAQASLKGTDGAFTSARLYTMIKDTAATTVEPISAIQAAAEDGTTSLLLGLWASAGQAAFDLEIQALKLAEEQYPDFASQIAGISVGSEDLYRHSNIANKTNTENPDKPLGPGVSPDVMLSYINQVKGNLTGGWSSVPVGHVDTWTAFTNDDGSFNQADLDALNDALAFFGVDSYPYFQGTMDNAITDSTALFVAAYQKVLAVAGDAEVWITETGWPTSGDTINLAEASPDNAEAYWQGVGCSNFGKINTWWYTFYDAHQDPSFGVSPSLSGGDPLFDLSCSGHTDGPDAASADGTTSGGVFTTVKASNSTLNGTSSSNSTSNSGSGSSGSASGSSSGSGSGSGSGPNGQSSGAIATFSSLLAVGGALVMMHAAL